MGFLTEHLSDRTRIRVRATNIATVDEERSPTIEAIAAGEIITRTKTASVGCSGPVELTEGF